MVVHLEHTALAHRTVVGARRFRGNAFLANTRRFSDQNSLFKVSNVYTLPLCVDKRNRTSGGYPGGVDTAM